MRCSKLSGEFMTVLTLGDLLRERAREKGDLRAYAVLDESADVREEVSYGGLYLSALRVGQALQDRCQPGSRVGIVFPSGINFLTAFFGCVLSGMIAVPMAPPKRNRRNERFAAIMRDAAPACALTLKGWTDLLKTTISDAGLAAEVFSITDEQYTSERSQDAKVAIRPEAIAYLQYTSGSIDDPKGVMVTHANVLSNSAFMRYVEENDERTVSLTWLPNFHDMGLAEGLIQPLFSAVPRLIMALAEFLHRPLLWLEAITRHQVTVSGGPNFAFDLCVEKASQKLEWPLDLSSWRVAYNGAEPIRDSTLSRFLQTFSPFGFEERAFYPVYGLAEATLVVSSDRRADLPFRLKVDREQMEQDRVVPAVEGTRSPQTLVASGSIQCGNSEYAPEVAIVDPASEQPLADGMIGEVYIRGVSVAAGYWNRPQQTADTFAALVRGRSERFARTGDLGFTWQRKLFLTGRSKDLIIVNGRNIYPTDIEWLAESAHPAIRPAGCAAFAEEIESGREDRIAVVCEVKRSSLRGDLKAAADAVRERVCGELEIELSNVVLIPPGALPKTSSGKVQRSVCRRLLKENPPPVLFSWCKNAAATEALVLGEAQSPVIEGRGELAILLSANTDSRTLRDDTPVFQYVRDSLHAVRLCQAVEQRFGVVPPASLFLGDSTIGSLSHWIAVRKEEQGRNSKSGARILPAEPRTSRRLSYGQEALWFLAAIAPESTAYHISRALEITGRVDVPVLRRALDLLIARHAALRTRFEMVNAVPHQSFNSSGTVLFEYEDIGKMEDNQASRHLAALAWRPFNLEKDALIRIHLLRLDSYRYFLLICIHHIFADLWSLLQFFAEGRLAYQVLASGDWPGCPAVSNDYPDFVDWQQSLVDSDRGQSLRDFWKCRVQPLPSETAIPLDRARPARMSFQGGEVEGDLDDVALAAIERASREFRTTPFCVMLSAYLVFLHRASGQSVVTAGVPVSCRMRQEFSGTIGFLANTVVISSEIGSASTWRDVLTQTREQLVSALDAQDYPFALVTESLGRGRDPRISPVFQQMFSFESLTGFGEISPLVVSREGR